jgi:ABC-type branched-subunit amino acid transport system substrate-binding protein
MTAAIPSIGVVSAAPVSGNGQPVGIALEQKNGYNAGLKAVNGRFAFKYLDESQSQGDIQRSVRDMVQSTEMPLVAMLGGTSNDATSHAAALANFFNVPMLAPSANGDNLFPSDNTWAFRLGAPGEAYAGYLFGNVLTSQSVGAISVVPENAFFKPELRIAIVYERNTFGESAAVAAAEAVMAQSLKIKVYVNFDPRETDPAALQKLVDKVKTANTQLVYLISSDPTLAGKLVQVFGASFDKESMPILVGQAGGFSARDFLNSKEAEGIYVLRQQIERSRCPANIQSSYDSQTYAAIYLLNQAVQQANISGLTVQKQREAIREKLKEINLNVPCLGMVAFDNAGQNKLIKLELVRIQNGKVQPVSTADFLASLKQRLAYFILP